MTTKAEKKLAKQLAREQLLVQIRKDTLTREEVLDAATLRKIKDKWFDAVVDTKVPQMQDNLRHILYYMEKLIEADSFRKSVFEDERQEAAEQTVLLAQSHASALGTLFDIYERRIQDLKDAYKEMVQEKKETAEVEFERIEEREKLTQENLQAMLYQMNVNKEKKEEMMNCDRFLKLDDERSKNTELKENLRTNLEKKMEKRWGEISATLSNYESSTRARRKEYAQLKAKDDADSKIIRQQMKKTQKLFEQLEELKKCMDECYAPKETIGLINGVREERAKFFSTFKNLKVILKEELKEDKQNLKILTAATNRTTEDLKKIQTQGENILTLFRICRRLETEMEKVIPVGDAIGQAKLNEGVKKKRQIKQEEIQEVRRSFSRDFMAKDFIVFDKFWRKVGQVRLSKLALEKCIRNMKAENSVLRRALTSYLTEVSHKEHSYENLYQSSIYNFQA